MAKKKGKPSPTHPKVWTKMKVKMQLAFGLVDDLFKPPSNPPARFKLMPIKEFDLSGKLIQRLLVKPDKGCLKSNWSRMVFDTCGTKKPPAISPLLPKWKNTKKVRNAYIKGTNATMNLLRVKTCTAQRIEAVYELIKKNANDIERGAFRIRAVYVPKCVDAGGGKKTDLVVFVAKTLGPGPAPDGGGTGPPTVKT